MVIWKVGKYIFFYLERFIYLLKQKIRGTSKFLLCVKGLILWLSSGKLLLIYFSVGKGEYSTSLSIPTRWRRGTGRGLVSSWFNLWEQLVLLLIQTKWSHVSCKCPLAQYEWGFVLNKRKTALHLTTAKSFVGQTGITYRLQPINNAPQVICILPTL